MPRCPVSSCYYKQEDEGARIAVKVKVWILGTTSRQRFVVVVEEVEGTGGSAPVHSMLERSLDLTSTSTETDSEARWEHMGWSAYACKY